MKERIKHLIIFILLIAFDQVTKYWVRTDLVNGKSIDIIPEVLTLQFHTNTGAVWGILGGKVEFLRIFTFIVLLLIIYFYAKIPQGKKYNVLKIIVVFIMAGAVGNLIDRMFLNYVVDFIYFELINFPLFNFADTYLTVSSILLFILAIFYYKDEDFVFLEQMFKKKNDNKAIDNIDSTSIDNTKELDSNSDTDVDDTSDTE